MLSKAREETPRAGVDLVEQLVDQTLSKKYASLEQYIREYLTRTGAKIETLQLCEEHTFEKDRLVTRYWLEPKK